MTDRKQLEMELNAFLKANFPDALDDFELVLKPTDAPDMNSNIQVQNLVKAIYYCFLQANAQSCTRLYILVSLFAETFKETGYLDELEKLWKGSNKKSKVDISIPTVETIVIRDLSSFNFRVNQKYNHGRGKVYRLADLNQALLEAQRRIMGIFNEIYMKYDLQIPFQMPALMQQASDKDVMQPL